MTRFATLLKKHRRQRGLSQEQLAERVGCSAVAVSRWEKNAACPTIPNLAKLADALGLVLADLIGSAFPPDGRKERVRRRKPARTS